MKWSSQEILSNILYRSVISNVLHSYFLSNFLLIWHYYAHLVTKLTLRRSLSVPSSTDFLACEGAGRRVVGFLYVWNFDFPAYWSFNKLGSTTWCWWNLKYQNDKYKPYLYFYFILVLFAISWLKYVIYRSIVICFNFS